MHAWITVTACAALLLAGAVEAKKSYQARIPNGANVTNPCNSTELWPGVGHWKRNGGGDLNPFGKAFENNGKVWNAALCRLDSDGDGKTNGQELGDPNCVWVEGAAPSMTTGITHPGVCEPIDTVNCKHRNGDKLKCGAAAIKSTLCLLCGLLLMALMLR